MIEKIERKMFLRDARKKALEVLKALPEGEEISPHEAAQRAMKEMGRQIEMEFKEEMDWAGDLIRAARRGGWIVEDEANRDEDGMIFPTGLLYNLPMKRSAKKGK